MLKCSSCGSKKLIKKGFCGDTGKQVYQCKNCRRKTVKPIGIYSQDPSIDRKKVSNAVKAVKKNKKWFITSAQNATPVFNQGLQSVHHWCKENNGTLIVIPNRYKNPTSVFCDKGHEWWDTSISNHIIDQRVDLCDGLVLLADIKVVPTARSPLTGMEGFTGSKSCILGHPHYQFHTVATKAGEMARSEE